MLQIQKQRSTLGIKMHKELNLFVVDTKQEYIATQFSGKVIFCILKIKLFVSQSIASFCSFNIWIILEND